MNRLRPREQGRQKPEVADIVRGLLTAQRLAMLRCESGVEGRHKPAVSARRGCSLADGLLGHAEAMEAVISPHLFGEGRREQRVGSRLQTRGGTRDEVRIVRHGESRVVMSIR
jgi:hypothetical protein